MMPADWMITFPRVAAKSISKKTKTWIGDDTLKVIELKLDSRPDFKRLKQRRIGKQNQLVI